MSRWEKGDELEAKSYADIHGEWEQRKISLWGAARAFITQLRVGQDMTRIVIPAIFLRPYSILEEIASRVMGKVHILNGVAQLEDPLKRMEGVVSWIICTGEAENFNHKPYNPIIGETHKARIEYDDGSKCFALCEQVEHHPPAAAFVCYNPTHGVMVEGNFIFEVTFHGNSVTIRTVGGLQVVLETPNGPERYILEKGMPDLLVKNVILGTKYVFWTGDLDFDCPQTGYHTTLNFGYESSSNTIAGTIYKTNEEDEEELVPVVELKGKCGYETFAEPAGETSKKKKKKDKEKFCDGRDHEKIAPTYAKWKDLEECSSIKLWWEVGDAVVDYDLDRADKFKTEIEERQRALAKEMAERNEVHVPRFFERTSDGPVKDFWSIKDKEWYKSHADINPDATPAKSSSSGKKKRSKKKK